MLRSYLLLHFTATCRSFVINVTFVLSLFKLEKDDLFIIHDKMPGYIFIFIFIRRHKQFNPHSALLVFSSSLGGGCPWSHTPKRVGVCVIVVHRACKRPSTGSFPRLHTDISWGFRGELARSLLPLISSLARSHVPLHVS